MLLILSGEGPSDIGRCSQPAGTCRNGDIEFGPMAILVDQVIASRLAYSVLHDTPEQVIFISKQALATAIDSMKTNKRNVALAGKKAGQETGYHMKYAWALGKMATDIENAEHDQAIAVFFRDADGTNANPGGNWEDKWDSIGRGFQRAQYPRGVPMLPKPTSEAWLLCAAQEHPYQHCRCLEDLPGNQVSQNHPKQLLDAAFGEHKSAADLRDWLYELPFDLERAVSMPSFSRFFERLNEALGKVGVPA